MKAVMLRRPGGLDRLEMVDIDPPPSPPPGAMLVRIYASSLNYHDLLVANGTLATEEGRIPLSDGAGVVEAVGEGVRDFAPGDTVVSVFFPTWHAGRPEVGDFRTVPGDGTDGYACEYVVRPATWFTHAPDGYSHEEAATLPCAGLTAWRALMVNGRLMPGETVLTMGSGGVSVFALQLAKACGARVIATSSSPEKCQRLLALGADQVINYRETPEWGQRVLDLTDGRGADHVVEVGGPGTLAQSLRAVRIGGHVSLIGVLTGWEGTVPTGLLMMRQARLHGLVVGSRAEQQDLVRALETTALKPVIDRRFPLGKLAEAFRLQTEAGHFGKICIDLP